MVHKITMPNAGQTTDKATISRWNKSVGDAIARGDILLEVETDKATLPIESFARGTLLKILFSEGDSVKAGEIIALVGDEEEFVKELHSDLSHHPESTQPTDQDDYTPIFPKSSEYTMASPVGKQAMDKSRSSAASKPFLASPAAKKAARDGNITLESVASACGKALLKTADICAFQSQNDDHEVIPLTAMRKTIATRMFASTSSVPSYTMEIETDMTAVKRLRDVYGKSGDRIAFHDILAKCLAAAIAKHPFINSSYADSGIMIRRKVNIGIAVAVQDGLVVPVVADVGRKRLAEIAKESSRLILKARSGKLTPDEIRGGTITISNLGSFPVARFNAIINPPESCILAISGIFDRPVAIDGTLVIKPIASITASFDHRVVDGANAAAFMTDLKQYIEMPEIML